MRTRKSDDDEKATELGTRIPGDNVPSRMMIDWFCDSSIGGAHYCLQYGTQSFSKPNFEDAYIYPVRFANLHKWTTIWRPAHQFAWSDGYWYYDTTLLFIPFSDGRDLSFNVPVFPLFFSLSLENRKYIVSSWRMAFHGVNIDLNQSMDVPFEHPWTILYPYGSEHTFLASVCTQDFDQSMYLPQIMFNHYVTWYDKFYLTSNKLENSLNRN